MTTPDAPGPEHVCRESDPVALAGTFVREAHGVGMDIELVASRGGLHLRTPVGVTIPLAETSRNVFHLKPDPGVRFEFEESAAGTVDSLLLHERGQSVRFIRKGIRRQAPVPDAAAVGHVPIPLERLAGRYAQSVAAASRTGVEMVVRDGTLFAVGSAGREELVAAGGNRFHLKKDAGTVFEFVPPEAVRVAGFILTRAGQRFTFTRLDILEERARALYALDAADPTAADYRVPERLDDGLEVGSIADTGAREAFLLRLLQNLRMGAHGGIDGLLILKDGRLIVEQYFNGWTRDAAHPMQSISKSITSLLVGSAVRQGHIASIRDPILKYLPDHAHVLEGGKQAITVRDLLTMSAGLDWNESAVPYTDPTNIRVREAQSDDSVTFTLSLPLANEPGTVFTYSGGLVTVAGEVIRNAVDADSLSSYWPRSTLAALGIGEVGWARQVDGRCNAAGGAKLRPRDLAKLGQMMLDGGLWRTERVLDDRWVAESLASYPYNVGPDSAGEWPEYGYFWWGGRYRVGDRDYEVRSAQGWGDQELLIIRELGLVIVITATNYDAPPVAREIVTRLIIPAWTPPPPNPTVGP